MSKLFWRAIKATPVVVGASFLAASSAFAQAAPTAEANQSVDGVLNQINHYNSGSSEQTQAGSLSQVTNVNQLRDVSPTDWAYEALRSLVDRYGCIVGYPNQTYRGNRALSRYEFAAGLNACLNQIERLIASSEAIAREDIDTLNRLTQEFEAELATLSGRVDNLESRTAFLEDHQFSTTTKLKGEAIFAIADTFGGGNDVIDEEDDADELQTTFSDRVRLNFDTSFTGKDRLRTRLEAGNFEPLDDDLIGTDSTRLGFDADGGNNIELSDLHYRFPFGERITAYVGAAGLDLDDIFEVNNPILESSGTGALSRFNRRNPLTLRGPEGTGIGAKVEITERIGVNALYLAEDAASPEEGEGLFNGSYSAGAQITFEPFEALGLAFTYVRSYQTAAEFDAEEDEFVGNPNLTGSTISNSAKNPFNGLATTANRFGVGANYMFGERFVVSGFGGYIDASAPALDDSSAEIWTWGATFSILDLGREGAVFSVAGGQLPNLTGLEVNGNDLEDENEDTSYLIEALYKFPINDNILITPGAFIVLNPDGDEDRDAIWVGVIRTTFKF